MSGGYGLLQSSVQSPSFPSGQGASSRAARKAGSQANRFPSLDLCFSSINGKGWTYDLSIVELLQEFKHSIVCTVQYSSH